MSSNLNSEVEKLSELCLSIRDGDWIETKDQSSNGYRLLQIGNIGVGKFRESGKPRFVSKETFQRLNCTKIEMGDVLIARMPDPTGRAWCVDSELPDSITSVDVAIVRVDPQKLDAKYLSYFLNQESTLRLIASLQTGTTRQRIKRSDLCNLEIFTPPISTQKAIARTLSNLDLKIALNNHLSKTLEDIAQTIFKSWFIDFDPVKAKMAGKKPTGMDAAAAALFPDSMEESELGLIPSGWNIRPIGDSVIKQKVGKLFDSKTSFPSGSVPVLDQGKSGVVGFHNEEPGIFASPEMPLVVFANHTCSLRLVSYPFSVIQNVFPLIGNKVDVIWLYFAVEGKQQFDSYKGHWPDFVLHKIIQPPEEATRAFRMIVEPLLKEKWLLEQQSKILGNIRDSLLPRLISGELQIPEEMLAS